MMKMHQVDAFSQTLFSGNNPAAVIVLGDESASDELMQNIAFENNLAETAFVIKQNDENDHIHWF